LYLKPPPNRPTHKKSRIALAAGLVNTLRGAGPFAVFAPTDGAFAKILTHHVVDVKVMAEDVKGGRVKTVQGGMTVNGAKMVAAGVAAENGLIHALTPSSCQNKRYFFSSCLRTCSLA
jgi:uncharacterized surface protein with fasciclin (FAS1) repeats